MVYPALLPLMRTTRLPVDDWTDAPRWFKLTRPFRRKTKSGFFACAITFQLACTSCSLHKVCSRLKRLKSINAPAALRRRQHIIHYETWTWQISIQRLIFIPHTDHKLKETLNWYPQVSPWRCAIPFNNGHIITHTCQYQRNISIQFVQFSNFCKFSYLNMNFISSWYEALKIRVKVQTLHLMDHFCT